MKRMGKAAMFVLALTSCAGEATPPSVAQEAEPARATSAALIQAGVDWPKHFEGGRLPGAFSATEPVFSVASGTLPPASGATATSSGGIFTLSSTVDNAISYQVSDLAVWNASTDTTVELRAKVLSGTDNTSPLQGIKLGTGLAEFQLNFSKGAVSFQGGASYALDTLTAHTYRITLQGGTLAKLYVDGNLTPVLSHSIAAGTAPNRLRFGDLYSSFAGAVDWDYIRWTNGGAYPMVDAVGVRKLRETKAGGRTWASTAWSNGTARTLTCGGLNAPRDPADPFLSPRGNGTIAIDGLGVATMSGTSPRMYVNDAALSQTWLNVEVSFYAKRISEVAGEADFRGFTVGTRSDHQHDSANNCVHSYYAKHKFSNNKAFFMKEARHLGGDGGYSNGNNGALVNLTAPTVGEWRGYKLVVRTITGTQKVRLQYYQDTTDGANGGNWQLMTSFTDFNGALATGVGCLNAGEPDLDDPYLLAGRSTYLRADSMTAQYRQFSVREVAEKADETDDDMSF